MDDVVIKNLDEIKKLAGSVDDLDTRFKTYVHGVQDAEANREFMAGVRRVQAETIAGWQPFIQQHGIDAAREHWSEVNPGKAFPVYLEQ